MKHFSITNDARSKQKQHIDVEEQIGFALALLPAAFLIYLEQVALDVVEQPRVAIPAEEADGVPGWIFFLRLQGPFLLRSSVQ